MTDKKNKLYYLSKVEFLSDLGTHELSELAADFSRETYPQGSDIIRQGDEQHRFYVLVKGTAEVLINKKGHSSWQVNSFTAGDTFGEISLITGKSAPTTVRCREDCEVLVLEAEQFARMLIHWPKLYRKFIDKLSHNLNTANHVLWETKHKEFLRSSLQLTQYQDKFYGLWGSVRTTKEIENKINELAQKQEDLLLIGERGTGRQMLAWFLHKRRFGESAPFIALDGPRFDRQWGEHTFEPSENLDSSLFKSSSLLEIATGGTLFIEEINLISPRAQLKLANALQSSNGNCMVIGTLQKNPDLLEEKLIPELKECFKQTFKINPLRERKRDIPILVQGILEKLALKHEREVPTLNPEAIKLLLSHNYHQGNVTELIQVIERAFFLAEDNVIGLEHIFFGPTAQKIGRTINLLSWKSIEQILKNGRVILWLQRFSAAVFASIVLLLLFAPATPTGIRIFTLVWGLWWPALVIVSPFLGRVWCTVCPFSFFMDKVQRKWHWNRPVPDFLKKYDYIIVTILFVFIYWIEVVTSMRFHPGYTVALLLIIVTSAVLTGLIFQRHTWCSHLCPLGGFVGVASIGAMLEIRSDATVCLNKCTTHDCYKGNGTAPGCPMSQHLPYLDNNLGCKLCFNCVRNCPNEAVQFNLRIPAREVWHLVRVNQGYSIFTAVSLAILIPINYFEPLNGLWPTNQWQLWFSISYWGTALAAGLLTWLLAKPFKTKAASRSVKLAFAFIPLVLAGHIIYQLHFLPGADSLILGFGWKTGAGLMVSHYIPAYVAAQFAATVIGLALTTFTILMVLLRTKDKKKLVKPPIPEQRPVSAKQ